MIGLIPKLLHCTYDTYDYTVLLLINLLLHVHALINHCKLCWNDRGSIDKLLTFNIGLLQLIFHTHLIHTHAKLFSIQIFQYFSYYIRRIFFYSCSFYSYAFCGLVLVPPTIHLISVYSLSVYPMFHV